VVASFNIANTFVCVIFVTGTHSVYSFIAAK